MNMPSRVKQRTRGEDCMYDCCTTSSGPKKLPKFFINVMKIICLEIFCNTYVFDVRYLIGFIPMEKCSLESAKMLSLDNQVDVNLKLW